MTRRESYWKGQAELWHARWKEDTAFSKEHAAKGDTILVTLRCPHCGNTGQIEAHITGLPTQFKATCELCEQETRIYVCVEPFTQEQFDERFEAVVDSGRVAYIPRIAE